MRFGKTTRQIVSGKTETPRTAEGMDSAQALEQSAAGRAEDDAAMRKMTLLIVDIAVIAALLVAVLIQSALLRQARAEAPEAFPIPDGQTVVAVAADEALTGCAESGDIVRVYEAGGGNVPELRYLAVYDTKPGALLLLADEEQARLLLALEAPGLSLVVHGDREAAETRLELQRRICDPEIALTVQPLAAMQPGETLALETSASVDPGEAALPEIVWQSDDEAVATVAGGVVTAVAPGETAVRAVCGDAEAVCTVTVEIPLTALSLDKTAATVAVGETVLLTAAPEPENATGVSVSWKTADSGIATVAEDGTVTAVAPGSTVITAVCGDVEAVCTVTVGIHAEVVQLEKQTLTLTVGAAEKLVAGVYPGENVIDKRTFESDHPEIAAVAEDGTVTAIAPGTATITFRCGGASSVCTVTVTAK